MLGTPQISWTSRSIHAPALDLQRGVPPTVIDSSRHQRTKSRQSTGIRARQHPRTAAFPSSVISEIDSLDDTSTLACVALRQDCNIFAITITVILWSRCRGNVELRTIALFPLDKFGLDRSSILLTSAKPADKLARLVWFEGVGITFFERDGSRAALDNALNLEVACRGVSLLSSALRSWDWQSHDESGI